MKKKILILGIILTLIIMLVGLTGCGEQKQQQEENKNQKSSESSKEPTEQIGVKEVKATSKNYAVVKGNEDDFEAYIGIVTDSKILVEKIGDGKAQFISTYEKNTPEDVVFAAETPDDACKFIFDEGAFAEFENPVSSVAAIFDGKWKIAGFNPE